MTAMWGGRWGAKSLRPQLPTANSRNSVSQSLTERTTTAKGTKTAICVGSSTTLSLFVYIGLFYTGNKSVRPKAVVQTHAIWLRRGANYIFPASFCGFTRPGGLSTGSPHLSSHGLKLSSPDSGAVVVPQISQNKPYRNVNRQSSFVRLPEFQILVTPKFCKADSA